ncbi:MAG TPA: methyltransferase domain-containing protein [Streptosporangiaceae bacterium]|jgi:2-polyprenyl-3-methyl-5-hydroxy-6-metoxy-1,4-benzoquinol methylase
MLAKTPLPAQYAEWNKQWGAPSGRRVPRPLMVAHRLDDPDPARYGPFGFQYVSETRRFEYPWAYFEAAAAAGMRVLDVGGGLGGLQFVLSAEGVSVVNVDPAARGDSRWALGQGNTEHLLTAEDHARLNQVFGTDVTLIARSVQDSGLAAGSFDRVFCLSVLEHMDLAEARAVLTAIGDLLVPGGLCLLTVDLFLDVKPFGRRPANFWGTNHDVSELLDGLELELSAGDPSELLGFPEFDPDAIVGRLTGIFVSPISPCMSQAMVLRMPG